MELSLLENAADSVNKRAIFAIALQMHLFWATANASAVLRTGFLPSQSQTTEAVRVCTSDSLKSQKKSTNTSHHQNKRVAAEAGKQKCVEVRAKALAIQEYLQKLIWELHWTVNDERASEELWSFTMKLNPEELTAYAKLFADPKMQWSSGKTVVNVRTMELEDGFTRVTVTATFEGYGVPEDKFAPKRESWPIPSNGALESKIADAIKQHFKNSP